MDHDGNNCQSILFKTLKKQGVGNQIVDTLKNLFFYKRTEWPLNLSAQKDAAGSGDCHLLPKGKVGEKTP